MNLPWSRVTCRDEFSTESTTSKTLLILISPELLSITALTSNSCPYLSKQTGIYFRNFKDFKKKISSFKSSQFSARKWILKKGTIDFTSKKLINILKI